MPVHFLHPPGSDITLCCEIADDLLTTQDIKEVTCHHCQDLIAEIQRQLRLADASA